LLFCTKLPSQAEKFSLPNTLIIILVLPAKNVVVHPLLYHTGLVGKADYGLDNRRIRFPLRIWLRSLSPFSGVHIGSGSHLTSYLFGTGISSCEVISVVP